MAPMKRVLPALRGLTLGLSISVMNLLGMFLTLLVLGGLGSWSSMQFIGAFGIFEIATAFAFMFCPNIWRLPVIEAETSDRTSIHLAASTAFITHWAGGAKAIAGVAMLIVAARSEGVGLVTLGIVPLAFATGVFIIGVSAIAARWGVARPDLDVVKIVVRRPKHNDTELPGISLSASTLQIVLGAFTLPVVKILPASSLYQPEVGPSVTFVVAMLILATASVLGTLFVWRGRMARHAPREQQRKAEEPA
jgi:hypothetical protein